MTARDFQPFSVRLSHHPCRYPMFLVSRSAAQTLDDDFASSLACFAATVHACAAWHKILNHSLSGRPTHTTVILMHPTA